MPPRVPLPIVAWVQAWWLKLASSPPSQFHTSQKWGPENFSVMDIVLPVLFFTAPQSTPTALSQVAAEAVGATSTAPPAASSAPATLRAAVLRRDVFMRMAVHPLAVRVDSAALHAAGRPPSRNLGC